MTPLQKAHFYARALIRDAGLLQGTIQEDQRLGFVSVPNPDSEASRNGLGGWVKIHLDNLTKQLAESPGIREVSDLSHVFNALDKVPENIRSNPVSYHDQLVIAEAVHGLDYPAPLGMS